MVTIVKINDKREKASTHERAPHHEPKVNAKKKEKGVYKGQNKLTPEELERHKRENRCFKCGEQRHSYRACPTKATKKDLPQATQVSLPPMMQEEATQLCFAWEKVRDQDALMLFDPGSTHNLISIELALR